MMTMNMKKFIDKLIFNNVYCSYFIILTNRAISTRTMLSSKKFNLIILGDGAVGKTSLLKMYHSGSINVNHIKTIGVDHINTTF